MRCPWSRHNRWQRARAAGSPLGTGCSSAVDPFNGRGPDTTPVAAVDRTGLDPAAVALGRYGVDPPIVSLGWSGVNPTIVGSARPLVVGSAWPLVVGCARPLVVSAAEHAWGHSFVVSAAEHAWGHSFVVGVAEHARLAITVAPRRTISGVIRVRLAGDRPGRGRGAAAGRVGGRPCRPAARH